MSLPHTQHPPKTALFHPPHFNTTHHVRTLTFTCPACHSCPIPSSFPLPSPPRRCEARRRGRDAGCMYLASQDLDAAKALPTDETTTQMIQACQEALDRAISGEPESSDPSSSSPLAKSPSPLTMGESHALRVPKHRFSVRKEASEVRTLEIAIELPGVLAFKELTLELSQRRILLTGCGWLLDEALPFEVDSEKTAAKFSKKSQLLRVTAPEA